MTFRRQWAVLGLVLLLGSQLAFAQSAQRPQALASGVAVENLSDSSGNDRYFYIDVPPNTSALRIELSVNSGDPDIYVDTVNPPPLDFPSTALCFSYNEPTENELCVVNNPSAGRYYIRVNAFDSYAAATLTATVPPSAPILTAVKPEEEGLTLVFQAGSSTSPTTGYTATCAIANARLGSREEPTSIAAESPQPKDSYQASRNRSAPQPRALPKGLRIAPDNPVYQQLPTGEVIYKQHSFPSLKDFHSSSDFINEGLRCGVDEAIRRAAQRGLALPRARSQRAADCTTSLTRIDPSYNPLSGGHYVIPVYFHVIYKADGTGWVSEQRVIEQIDVLNQDFGGAMGLGTDTTVKFNLVGITYTVNDEWFTDSPEDELAYKSALAKDTRRFLNIYTNDAGGDSVLGYAYLPQGSAGLVFDGVVMWHSVIGGRDNGFGNYDEGRTLVHEVGHYLGLQHTFAPGSVCENSYQSGDLIVDTPAQLDADYGCSASTSCGVNSAIENFMNYANDACMFEFTQEQTNRMICSLTSYRPDTFSVDTNGVSTASGTRSPLFVGRLTPGLTYNCSVVAINAAGSSAASSSLQGVPDPASSVELPLWLIYEATKP